MRRSRTAKLVDLLERAVVAAGVAGAQAWVFFARAQRDVADAQVSPARYRGAGDLC